jgi:allophanate hydrolase subunit 1
LRSLERLDGVMQVVPGGDGVTVAYDPVRLTPERIAAAVTRDTGYVVRPRDAARGAAR